MLAVQRIGIASRATVPGETRSREGWGHRDTASGGLGASAELAGNPRTRSAEMLLLLSWRVTASHYFFRKMMEGKEATMNKKQRFSWKGKLNAWKIRQGIQVFLLK